jgi:Flp pilus assembly pilin Flp
MSKFISPISRLFSRVQKDEKGTQLVETAIWLGIISAGAVAAVVAIAPQVTTALTRVQTALGTLNP